MKPLRYFFFLLFGQLTLANAITVPAVKVSITADSVATAREKALEEAHRLAFVKLMKENYPEASSALAPQETLMNMITTFSIDKEKTTPNSYTALMTFHFDDAKVQEWLEHTPSFNAQAKPSHTKEIFPLKIAATYTTQQEWILIKKALETKAIKLNVITLSPQNATLELLYEGDVFQLQHLLQEQNLDLIPQGEEWKISVRITNNDVSAPNS